MSEAPERIWATGDSENGSWNSTAPHGTWRLTATEYVRSDLAPAWQRIASAPRDGAPIDLWHRSGFRCNDCWWDGAWIGAPDDDVTHWMPLTAPPEVGG
jgi:hypothetical protein